MKYVKVIWSFINNNIYGFTIGAAILLATLAALEARSEVLALTFNTYFCLSLFLGVLLGIKTKSWSEAKAEFGKLFLVVTALSMVIAKTCGADSAQTMYLILMTNIFVGGSFFLAHMIVTTPNPFKAGNVVVTHWSILGGLTYTLVSSYILLVLPKYSPQIAEFILVSVR